MPNTDIVPALQQAVGARITSLDRVYDLAVDRKSIWFDGWNGPKPAAFVVGMKLVTVKQFLERGMFEYNPVGRKSDA